MNAMVGYRINRSLLPAMLAAAASLTVVAAVQAPGGEVNVECRFIPCGDEAGFGFDGDRLDRPLFGQDELVPPRFGTLGETVEVEAGDVFDVRESERYTLLHSCPVNVIVERSAVVVDLVSGGSNAVVASPSAGGVTGPAS